MCNDIQCRKNKNGSATSPKDGDKVFSAVNICSICFAKGKEFLTHKSYHDYTIVKRDFSLFASEWNANEEMLLLNAMLQFGHGNWDDIAR